MNNLIANTDSVYELRFADLAHPGHAYVFPCNAYGQVDLDRLSDGARANYFFARASIGHHLAWPTIEVGNHEAMGPSTAGPRAAGRPLWKTTEPAQLVAA